MSKPPAVATQSCCDGSLCPQSCFAAQHSTTAPCTAATTARSNVACKLKCPCSDCLVVFCHTSVLSCLHIAGCYTVHSLKACRMATAAAAARAVSNNQLCESRSLLQPLLSLPGRMKQQFVQLRQTQMLCTALHALADAGTVSQAVTKWPQVTSTIQGRQLQDALGRFGVQDLSALLLVNAASIHGSVVHANTPVTTICNNLCSTCSMSGTVWNSTTCPPISVAACLLTPDCALLLALTILNTRSTSLGSACASWVNLVIFSWLNTCRATQQGVHCQAIAVVTVLFNTKFIYHG